MFRNTRSRLANRLAVPPPEVSRCQALTKYGQPCSRPALRGNKYCWQHQPNLRGYLKKALGLAVTLIGLVGLPTIVDYVNSITSPKPGDCELNIAIANFVAVEQDGTTIVNRQSEKLAESVYKEVAESFGAEDGACGNELGGRSIGILPPEYVGSIQGETEELREQAAEIKASEIKAFLIIDGILTDTESGRVFYPGFYVHAAGFNQAPELDGPYALGREILLDPDADQDHILIINDSLDRRTRALVNVAFGVAYMADNSFETARSYFEKAGADLENEEGKDVVYLLIGNTFLHTGSEQELNQNLDQALAYYEAVLEFDCAEAGCSHARAILGKAIVLTKQGKGDPDRNVPTDVPTLDEAIALYRQVLTIPYPPEAQLEIKAHLGLGEALLYKAEETGECQDFQEAQAELEKVIVTYETGGFDSDSLTIRVRTSLAYARLARLAHHFVAKDDLPIPIQYYENAAFLATAVDRAEILLQIGTLRDEQDEYALACAAYRQCAEYPNAAGKCRLRVDGDVCRLQYPESKLELVQYKPLSEVGTIPTYCSPGTGD